jgi:putative nucleotidyltransferase with HDIG domain
MIMERKHIVMVCRPLPEKKGIAEDLALHPSYEVSFVSDASAALSLIRAGHVDLVIADLDLCEENGGALIKEIKAVDRTGVIVVLCKEPSEAQAETLGVYECVKNPPDVKEFGLIVRKGIQCHSGLAGVQRQVLGLQEKNAALEKQVMFLTNRLEETTKNLTKLYENLRATYMHTVKVLAQAIDARDHYTHSHSENVVKYAAEIAREMGLSVREIQLISEACQLHDLGKVGVEDTILSKPSSLTDEEWQQIRRHPTIAAQILEPLSFLSDVIEMIRQHHEHFDGSGYPDGRRGGDILLGARIIHLADAYEAMTSKRAYRKVPLSKEAATEEIKKHRGDQFDPDVVDAFLRVVDKF